MSIHTRTPTESQSSTDPRPTPEPTETGDAADDGESADSWVERCQRSFSTTDTRRLRNLTDGENEAMPNPE